MIERIKLTPEQEQQILCVFEDKDNKNLPSITALVRSIFPQAADIDGRSKEGRAIKEFLVAKNLKAQTKTLYAPVDKIELSEAHKEFINNNQNLMSPVDMTRVLFANNNLNNLTIECRAVAEYIRTLAVNPNSAAAAAAADVPIQDYSPSKSVEGILKRVDKYVFNHGIDREKMTAQHRAGLEALLGYTNTFRFVNQMNLYDSQNDRDLFESSFIGYCFDKPDLTKEEVDQYINVAHDNIAMAATTSRMERLSVMLDNVAGNPDDRARISMSLVEAIGALSTELNQVAKRQQSLLGDLKQKRSDRIAQLRSANASILNLVQLWREEKSRKRLLHLGEARKELVRKAASELATMEEVKARIMGLDLNQVLNG